MKRKLIIFAIIVTYFFSAFTGLASLLATGPDSNEMAPIVVAGTEPVKRPIKPAPDCLPNCASTNGESWGG